MENFTDLESLYRHLEDRTSDYRYSHQISSLFQKVRDLKYKENELDEAERAQWEIDFFSFCLTNGEIKSMFTRTNENGELVEYPNIDTFDNKTYKYLIERLNSTSNPLLKARYSHIIWCSPKKHAKYARMAVNSYLELIGIYEKKDEGAQKEHFGLFVLEAVENAYSIAYQIHYGVERIKSELRRLITEFNFDSVSSFALRSRLIELMLRRKRRFSKEDFLGFGNICWQVYESLFNSGNIHASIHMLELGERVDRKLEKTTYDWGAKIAESYEILMKKAEERNNPASMHFCQLALRNYKRIKDKGKIKELEEKYIELKHSVKLAEFKSEIDLTEHRERCRDIATEVVQHDPEEIIKILTFNENLLPKYKDVEKAAEECDRQFVVQSLFPRQVIDQSGHPAQYFSDENEKKYYSILNQYRWELELNKIHLVNEIFFAAIRENKLSADILLKFLSKYSWLGKNISKKLPNKKIIEYSWMNLIAPSLHEYFIQMHFYFLNPTHYPNLILCIDSLTLKIEGLLRDICQFSGVTTFYVVQDNKGRDVTREKDVHALLYEDPIKELFDDDDLLFLRFLLVEKAGYNLRHKIAHSLMPFQQYSIECMHLLILAVLRLGKYDFVKKEDSGLQDSKQES